MSRVTKAKLPLSIEEVKERMQKDARPMYRKRWMSIYHAFVAPRSSEEMAKQCGVSKFTVQKLISRENRCGFLAGETGGKGGRRRE